MRYYDIEYTPKTQKTYVEGVNLPKEKIGITSFPETDKRVTPWFSECPKDCKRDFDKNGFPIFIKCKLDEDNNLYLFYTKETDVDGILLPDLEKIEKERIKNEKLAEEGMIKRKLEIISIESSSSFQLKTFGSRENYLCPICRNYENRENHFAFHTDYFTDIYNFSNNIYCDRCGSNSMLNIQVNFLKKLKEVIKEDYSNNIYLLLGAKEITASFNMKANQLNDIHFEELGIPSNARILDIKLHPNCNLSLFTLIPNNIRFTNTIIHKNILSFWTNDIFNEEESNSEENRLLATIKWLDIDMNNLWDINLLNTIDNFINNNQNDLILNANRTLELLCTQICYKEFSKNLNNYSHLKPWKIKDINNKIIKEDGYASYGTLLNHFICEIINYNNIVQIDETFLDKIKFLNNTLRNEIAHKGQLEDDLTSEEKIDILAIAVLGSSLMKYVYNSLE
jgi:hypothetical protein